MPAIISFGLNKQEIAGMARSHSMARSHDQSRRESGVKSTGLRAAIFS